MTELLMASSAVTLYINESGDVMQDLFSSSIRSGQVELVQRYGRYYTLTTVRWLSEAFSELSYLACCTHNLDAFFGMWEFLQPYIVEDALLKSRKRWP